MRKFKFFALFCAVSITGGLALSGGIARAGDTSGLAVQASVDPGTVAPGGEFLWSVQATNVSEGQLNGVTLQFHIFNNTATFDLAATSNFNGSSLCKKIAGSSDILCKIGNLGTGDGENQTSIGVVVKSATTLTTEDSVHGLVSGEDADANAFGSDSIVVHISDEQPNTDSNTSFVAPGGTISVGPKAPNASNPTVGSFTLPKKELVDPPAFGAAAAPKPVPGPGAVITISADDPSTEPGACGGLACDGKIINVSDFDGYHDKTHPAFFKLSWAANVLGAGSALYIIKPVAGVPTGTVVPKCVKVHGAYMNTPCLAKHAENKKTHKITDTIAILSGDPGGARRG